MISIIVSRAGSFALQPCVFTTRHGIIIIFNWIYDFIGACIFLLKKIAWDCLCLVMIIIWQKLLAKILSIPFGYSVQSQLARTFFTKHHIMQILNSSSWLLNHKKWVFYKLIIKHHDHYSSDARFIVVYNWSSPWNFLFHLNWWYKWLISSAILGTGYYNKSCRLLVSTAILWTFSLLKMKPNYILGIRA